MMRYRIRAYTLCLALAFLLPCTSGHAAHENAALKNPVLVNSCVVTSHVKQLVEVYRRVLLVEPRTSTDENAEFTTGVGVLALFFAKAQEVFIPGSAQTGTNRSLILEFRVNMLTANISGYRAL